ncbi:SWIB/MDM2 domain-containing protein [Terfezia claveryi]|nr:SWIB/MDM2 domain-containing protein [Terfezia claveryi]
MATVNSDQRKAFTRIIDDFLRSSDLTTITLRTVRAHLQEKAGYDLDFVKTEIKSLITERFDEILHEKDSDDTVKKEIKEESATTDDGHSGPDSPAFSMPSSNGTTKTEETSSKRKLNLDKDAKLAAKLHEELNAGRPSRSGSASQKKKSAPKKKVVKKGKAEINSDLSADGNGEPEKKKRTINRSNPFNAPMQLSEALSGLIGKSECSRPECVKSIWAYVKENGLQDPTDKRYIICDESMKRVFNGAARVHMFTMNKVLSNHIFPLPKKTEETGST